MSKDLMIVESPAKAKTIEKYLGGDFTVVASFGHVRDLPKGSLGIDIKHNLAPSYFILPKSKRQVSSLKKLTTKLLGNYLKKEKQQAYETFNCKN